MRYVASKDQKEFMKDLKRVYQADTKDQAETALLELAEKWEKKYPVVIKSWNNNRSGGPVGETLDLLPIYCPYP